MTETKTNSDSSVGADLLLCPFCDAKPNAPYINNVGETWTRIKHGDECFFRWGMASGEQWIHKVNFQWWNTRATQPQPLRLQSAVSKAASEIVTYVNVDRFGKELTNDDYKRIIATIDRYLSAATQPKVGEQWQPIESAPNDGTRVLLWAAKWDSQPILGWKEEGGWADDGHPTSYIEPPPTHWMSLPLPPTQPNSVNEEQTDGGK